MMYYRLRVLFHLLVLRPLIYILWLGLNITGRQHIPTQGPAIIVCNHNSHLDTFILLALLPVHMLDKVRPVAAADYFMKNRFLKWYSTKILRIVPVVRGSGGDGTDPLIECHHALEKGHVLFIYPEGTRGESKELAPFKKGVAYLAEAHQTVPVFPVYIRGLEIAFPKGAHLPLPYSCDVVVGEARFGEDDREKFLQVLYDDIETFAAQFKDE